MRRAWFPALLMALLLHLLEKQVPHIQEALIGGSFVTLARNQGVSE